MIHSCSVIFHETTFPDESSTIYGTSSRFVKYTLYFKRAKRRSPHSVPFLHLTYLRVPLLVAETVFYRLLGPWGKLPHEYEARSYPFTSEISLVKRFLLRWSWIDRQKRMVIVWLWTLRRRDGKEWTVTTLYSPLYSHHTCKSQNDSRIFCI